MAWLEFNPDRPDYEKFRKTLWDAMADYRPDAETLYTIAFADMRERHTDEAAKLLEQALQLDPRHENAARLLVECFRYNLDFEKVLQLQRTRLKHYPNRRIWQDGVLDTLLVLQRYDEAIETMSKRLAESGLEAREANALRTLLVHTHLLRKEYASAIEILDRWWEREKDNAGVLLWLIEVCQTAGQHDRALSLIHRWKEDIPDGLAMGNAESIWAALIPDQYDEVEQIVLEGIEDAPDSSAMQIQLIALLRTMKRYDEAVELAKNNAAIGQDATEFQLEVYRTYDAAGRTDDAIALIREMATKSEPRGFPFMSSQPILREMEAYQLIKAGRYGNALKKINRWIEDAQSQDEKRRYLELLSSCHQEAGNMTEVMETLSLALELDPTSVDLSNSLGYTWADVGIHLERAEKLIV